MKEDDIPDEPARDEQILAWLRSRLAQLLDVGEEQLPTDRPLRELGMDSLTAVELSHDIEERSGMFVPLERFVGDTTLEDVARELAATNAATRVPPSEATAT